MALSGKAMSNDHLKPSRYLAFGTCSHEARLSISKVGHASLPLLPTVQPHSAYLRVRWYLT